MTVAPIPTKGTLLLLAVALISPSLSRLTAAEVVSIRFTDGKKMSAELHRRTNEERLWLRFGSGNAIVLRGFAWESIANARLGDQVVTAAELRELAAIETESPNPNTSETVKSAAEPTYAERARAMLGFSRRITAVDFDVNIANWDRDVEFDGIALRLFPLDADRQLTGVRGTLYVELVAGRRTDFNEAPNARGLVPSRLGQWSVGVDESDVTENGVVVKLPFQTNQPEFDTNWATHGLVHVRLVVPGHGVFEHSFDGVRVRPYAPLRDNMERQSGQRFLPTEQTGVSKRLQ